jgi:hypothetical protein
VIPTLLPTSAGSGAERPTRGAVVTRVLALVLGLAAVTGCVAWLAVLSPLQLERWRAIETSHLVTFAEPGTYLLFEEGAGAASRRGDPQVVVSVRSIAGRPLPIRELIDRQGRSPQTYDIRTHQGRAIAAIDVDRPGRYVVVSFSATIDSGARGRREPLDVDDLPSLALGREGVPSRWGTWTGLLLLGGLPGALAVGSATLAWRRHPLPLGRPLRVRAGLHPGISPVGEG